MTLQRKGHLPQTGFVFGGDYNRLGARLIQVEVERVRGWKAAEDLVRTVDVKRVPGFPPGTRLRAPAGPPH